MDLDRGLKDTGMSSITKKAAAICILALFIMIIAAVAYKVCVPVLKMADTPEELRGYIEALGFWGPAFFILVTVIQVIAAVIPGGPLEIAAGYCFGAFRGALIADIGMTIGSVVVFLLVRKFGMSFVEIFFSREKIESLKFLKTTDRSRAVLFVLFLIPGSPKDILAYAVGLTDLGLASWIFITAVGRFPTILLSTLSGDALGEQRYSHFVIVFIIMAAAAGVGAFFYRRWSGKQDEKENKR